MTKCECCGRSLANAALDKCPVCYPLYMRDLETGHLPPHYILECFFFSDWAGVRILERNMRQQGSPDEAILEVVARCGAERWQSYEAVKAEQEEAMNCASLQADSFRVKRVDTKRNIGICVDTV